MGGGAGIHPGVRMPLGFGPAYATPSGVLAGRAHTPCLPACPWCQPSAEACLRVPGHSPKRSLGMLMGRL